MSRPVNFRCQGFAEISLGEFGSQAAMHTQSLDLTTRVFSSFIAVKASKENCGYSADVYNVLACACSINFIFEKQGRAITHETTSLLLRDFKSMAFWIKSIRWFRDFSLT